MSKKITNLEVIGDKEKGKYVKAWVTIDGERKKIEDHKEIRKLIDDLKKQENVKNASELSTKDFKSYYIPGNYMKSSADLKAFEKAKDKEYFQTKLSLKKKSPHEGKKTSGVKKFAKKALVVAAIVAVMAGATKCGYDAVVDKDKVRKEKEADDELDALKTKKEAPTSWDEYMTYEDSVQKTFAKNVMDKLIVPNIKTKEIDGETITYGLTPAQAMAFSLYYNSPDMSNEDLLAILGDYSLTGNSDQSKDLVNLVNSAVDTIRLSWVVADSKEEMIRPIVEDETVQNLIDKYMNLLMDYKKAENDKDKKAAKKAIEEALNQDFIDAKDGVIDLYEHPSAHIILNSIPATMSLLLDPTDEGLNKILVGTEGDFEVQTDGGKVNNKTVQSKTITIPETSGLVDGPCAKYNDRFENYNKFFLEKTTEKTAIDINNQSMENQVVALEQQIKTLEESKNLLNKKTIDAQIDSYKAQIESYRMSIQASEYDSILEDSYEYDTHDEHEGVIIPMMEKEVKLKGFDANFEEYAEKLHEKIIASIQAKQLNNTKPFSKSNPSGGKVGDTFVDSEQKGVAVTEAQVKEKIGESGLKEIQKEAAEKAGAVTEEEAQEEIKNLEEKLTREELGQKIYDYYKENGPNASKYEVDFEVSKEGQKILDTYIEYIRDAVEAEYNASQENNKVTDKNADNKPSHSENPNQNNNSSNSNKVEKPVEAPSKSEASSTVTDKGADTTPHTSQNPNNVVVESPKPVEQPKETVSQPEINAGTSIGSSTVIIDEDVIEGTVTTDSSNVFDPNQYGEYDDMTATYASLIVEEMEANPTSELEEESSKQLIK